MDVRKENIGNFIKIAKQITTNVLDDPKIRMALGAMLGASIQGGSEYLKNYDDPHQEKERTRRIALKALEGGLYGGGIAGLSSMVGPNIGETISV